MLAALLTPVLAGILLGCCFLPPPAHWLAWIGLVPVAAAITRRGRVVETYLGMYAAGLAFNLITTDWVRTLDNGSGLSGSGAPDWLFQAQLLALFWPLTLLVGRLLVSNWPMALGLPVVWTIHELLLRGLWALIDKTGWQVYFLGYAVVDHRYVAQIADLGGTSALGVVVACANGALWDLLANCRNQDGHHRAWRRALTGTGIAVGLLTFSYGYGAWRISHTQPADGPSVWLMPEDTLRMPPAQLPWRPDEPGAPDVLLWSELAYNGPPVDPSSRRSAGLADDATSSVDSPLARPDRPANQSETALEDLCRQFGVPMVVGYTRIDGASAEQRKYNAAAFVDPIAGFQGSYNKIGLVPWTEFTPLEGLTARRGLQFSHGATCRVFQVRSAKTHQTHRFAAAICYDVAFPHLFRRAMRTTAGVPEFFLVCSSERSDRTGRMSRHILNLARVRAIECRRTLVRNVHLGPSGTIDSIGQFRDASVPLLVQSPTSLGPIPIDSRSTLYTLWGDWIPASVVCVVLITAVVGLRRRGSSSRLRPARLDSARARRRQIDIESGALASDADQTPLETVVG